MEVILEDKPCPNCALGMVRIGGVANVVTLEAYVNGRCDHCEREYEQNFVAKPEDELVPLEEEEDDDEPKTLQGNI